MTSYLMIKFSFCFLWLLSFVHGLFPIYLTRQQALEMWSNLSSDHQSILPENNEWIPSCDSCAVVGNSGILLTAGHGNRIDSASCVFRFNWPPIKGFENDVGSKTTAMVCGSSSAWKSKYSLAGNWRNFNSNINVYFRLRQNEMKRKLFKTLDHLFEYTQRPSMKSRGIPTFGLFSEQFELFANNLLQQFLNDKFGDDRRVVNIFGDSFKPTSGLRGVVLALLTCKQVDVYGFGTDKHYGNGHYFQEIRRPILENAGHNYSIEHDLMMTLAQPNSCRKYFGALPCGSLKMHLENAISEEPVEKSNDQGSLTHRQELLQKKLLNMKEKGITLDKNVEIEILKHL